MRTREDTIANMCLTWDHNFLAPRQEIFPGAFIGLSDDEKKSLWNRMAQIYDNDIEPFMEFKK